MKNPIAEAFADMVFGGAPSEGMVDRLFRLGSAYIASQITPDFSWEDTKAIAEDVHRWVKTGE